MPAAVTEAGIGTRLTLGRDEDLIRSAHALAHERNESSSDKPEEPAIGSEAGALIHFIFMT